MGATLPILVADRVRRSGNVGRSVGLLYFANTLGSAAGSIAAGVWILGILGQERVVLLAALANFGAAGTVLGAQAARGRRR
jgi:spermidine synthase